MLSGRKRLGESWNLRRGSPGDSDTRRELSLEGDSEHAPFIFPKSQRPWAGMNSAQHSAAVGTVTLIAHSAVASPRRPATPAATPPVGRHGRHHHRFALRLRPADPLPRYRSGVGQSRAIRIVGDTIVGDQPIRCAVIFLTRGCGGGAVLFRAVLRAARGASRVASP